MVVRGCVTGKIRQPCATAAGSGIPAQLEVAILVADACAPHVHLPQACGKCPSEGRSHRQTPVARIKLDSEHGDGNWSNSSCPDGKRATLKPSLESSRDAC